MDLEVTAGGRTVKFDSNKLGAIADAAKALRSNGGDPDHVLVEASTLAILGGGDFAEKVNKCIKEAARDCFRYGEEDEKPRVVNIKIELKNAKGIIKLKAGVKANLPTLAVTENCIANSKGDLFFGVEPAEGEEAEDEAEAA